MSKEAQGVFARLAAAVVATLVATAGLVAAPASAAAATPAWDQGSTNDVTVGAYNGPAQGGNTFYSYVEAGGALDVRFEYVVTGAEEPYLRVVSPAGESFDVHPSSWSAGSGTIIERQGLTSQTAGVWTIEMRPRADAVNQIVELWYIAPRDADGTAHDGRTWAEQYYQHSQGHQGAGGTHEASFLTWEQTLWYMASSGAQYSQTNAGFNGFQSVAFANSMGVPEAPEAESECRPSYHSHWAVDVLPDSWVTPDGRTLHPSTVTIAADLPGGGWYGVADELRNRVDVCGGLTYRVFFEKPDSEGLPSEALIFDGAETTTTWVAPVYQETSVTGVTWTQTEPGAAYGGTIGFSVNGQPGTVRVDVDVDDNGVWTDPVDRSWTEIPVQPGVHSLDWDGRDGTGEPVLVTRDVRLRVSMTAGGGGEIHFLQIDTETRLGGNKITAMTGPQAGSSAISWNDSYVWDGGPNLGSCRYGLQPSTSVTCVGEMPLVVGTDFNSSGAVAHKWGLDPINPNTWNGGTWGDNKIIDDWMSATDSTVAPAELLLQSGVEVEKSADRATLNPGDTSTHTWTVANNGTVPLNGIEAVDDLTGVLPYAEVVAETVTASSGTAVLDLVGQRILWSGDIAAGEIVTVSYDIVVKPDAGDTQIYDKVTVTDLGEDDVTQLVTWVPGIAVTKSADPTSGTTVGKGDVVTYSLAFDYTGNGVTPAPVDYTDDLSGVLDDATFVGIVDNGGLTVTEPVDGVMRIEGTLSADTTVVYEVVVKDDGSGDKVLRNVVVEGPEPAGPDAPCEPGMCTRHPVRYLYVEKVGEGAGRLDGAEFVLRGDDGDKPGAVLTTTTVTRVEKGVFITGGIDAGVYWLEETKAPEGFQLLATAVKLQVAEDGKVTLLNADKDAAQVTVSAADDGMSTVTVTDRRAFAVPLTGGMGESVFWISGVLLLAAAAGYLVVRRRATGAFRDEPREACM